MYRYSRLCTILTTSLVKVRISSTHLIAEKFGRFFFLLSHHSCALRRHVAMNPSVAACQITNKPSLVYLIRVVDETCHPVSAALDLK